MHRGLIVAVALLALFYAGACLLLFLLQRSFIYFPQPRASGAVGDVERLAVPEAMLAVTVRPRPGAPALLYFGGNAEDVSGLLPELATALPDQALYLLHYRGYGGSSGSPSEPALQADALALYDHVRLSHADIRVVGRSLGTGVAIRVASERPVTRLVLITPFDSLQDLAVAQFPWFPVGWLLRDKFQSWRYAPQVTAPTLLIAAGRDDIVPLPSAEQLLRRFRPGVARLEVVPQAGHNDPALHPARLPALR